MPILYLDQTKATACTTDNDFTVTTLAVNSGCSTTTDYVTDYVKEYVKCGGDWLGGWKFELTDTSAGGTYLPWGRKSYGKSVFGSLLPELIWGDKYHYAYNGGNSTIIHLPGFFSDDSTTWGKPYIWNRMSPEEREAAEKKAKQAEERREKARQRADSWLMAHLSPHQQRDYLEYGFFHVVTRKRHKYRITKGRMGNVFRLNRRGKPVRAFCIHPKQFVPDGDTMLAQKLMLESNEEEFLRIANHRKVPARARAVRAA